MYYEAVKRDDEPLWVAVQEVAASRKRWGAPRVVMHLRRQGWADNHKRIERIYREESLQVRRRKRNGSMAVTGSQ
ncbi:MAG: IS3 family transposase [Kiritimatiellia bacterium]